MTEGIQYAKNLSEEIPKTNVFLVPGNHDVNRKSVTKSQTSYLDSVNDEAGITEMIRAGELEWRDNIRRLAEFKTFLENHGYGHLLEDPDRLVYGIERKIGNKTIGVGGFNSAWSCCRPSEAEKGKLWMAANWQSRTVLSKIKKADVRIALAHHPEGWFKEPEKQYFRRIQEKFHFILHGYEHDDWIAPISNHHAIVSAGACYERSGQRDGYNLVRID